MKPPVVIRVEDFPEQLRFSHGHTAPQRSGIVVSSERDANIAVSLRVPYEPFTFEHGESEITQIEPFAAGEQRAIVLDWSLHDPAGAHLQYVYLECDVRYEDREDERNTVTLAIPVDHGLNMKRLTLVGAVTAAAVAAALMAATRMAVRSAEEDDLTIGSVEVETPRRKPARPTATKSSKKQAGGTRRGSAASRSAPRKDARGSSAGRKSSTRPPTRKSR